MIETRARPRRLVPCPQKGVQDPLEDGDTGARNVRLRLRATQRHSTAPHARRGTPEGPRSAGMRTQVESQHSINSQLSTDNTPSPEPKHKYTNTVTRLTHTVEES